MEETSASSSKSRKRQRQTEEETVPVAGTTDQSLSLGLLNCFSTLFLKLVLCVKYYNLLIFGMHLNDNAEDNLSFSDTLVALRIMRAQFPRIEKVLALLFSSFHFLQGEYLIELILDSFGGEKTLEAQILSKNWRQIM